MSHSDNPAGRLFSLLENARRGQNQKLSSVWFDVLGVEPEDWALLLRRMATVLRLPEQVRREVTMLSDIGNHEDFVALLPKVETALRNLFQNDRNWLRTTIGEDTMVALRLISNLLSARRPQPVLDNAQLEAIRDEVRNITDEVNVATDLPSDLAEYLNDLLRDMLEALEHHQVDGSKPLQVAAERSIGGLGLLRIRLGDVLNHPVIQRIWRLSVVVSVTLSTVSGVAALPQSVEGFSEWVDETYGDVVLGPDKLPKLLELPSPKIDGGEPAPAQGP